MRLSVISQASFVKLQTKNMIKKNLEIVFTLKGPNRPSLLRVPSGKKNTDAPFFKSSMQRFKQSYNLHKS